jgi:hypothetical protein
LNLALLNLINFPQNIFKEALKNTQKLNERESLKIHSTCDERIQQQQKT